MEALHARQRRQLVSVPSPSPTRFRALAVAALLAAIPWTAPAATPWGTPIMQPGIGVVTCAAPASMALTNAWVMGLMDFRNPSPGDYGPLGPAAPLWNPPDYHHPSWTAETLGAVYGLAIDTQGDIYVAAHGLYAKTWFLNYHHRYGSLGGGSNSLAAAGTIYRINRTNGVPSVFAVLPQQAMTLTPGWVSGPGLGNVAHDPVHNQFFATNLEDGRIYRIDSAGAVVQTFDPLGADTGAAGLPPLGELLWGIGVSQGAVHYAVWNTGGSTSPGKIRRIQISGTGALLPSTDAEILTVPASPIAVPTGWAQAVPVSDIAFSADGTRMILGERTMLSPTDSYNHASRVHIAVLSGSTWTVTRTLETGNSWGRGEAYGGVAYGEENGAPEQILWMTSADLADMPGPHGIQGVRPADFPLATTPSIVTNAFRVPFDPAYTTSGPDFKGSGGDVEIMPGQPCTAIKVLRVECPKDPGAPIDVTIEINNLSGVTVNYAWFTPCPTNLLPAGAITLQPIPTSVFNLPGPLTNNGTAVVTFQLPPGADGHTVCFRLTLLNESGEVCCTEKLCVVVPDCDCARLVEHKIDCRLQPDGTILYTLQLVVENLTHLSPNPFPFYYATFLPPSGFSPAHAIPVPNPIPPGGTGVFTTSFTGSPGPLCFHLTLHDESIDPCCSIPVCLELPPCAGTPVKPDFCAVDERVPCRPNADGTPGSSAIIHYTVCNNSTVPRTYTWAAAGLPASPPCTHTLPASAFFPPTGTLGPIPPGGCLTVPIVIRCPDFAPGECARFEVCASAAPDLPRLCCRGTVFRPRAGDPVIVIVREPDTAIPTLTVGGSLPLAFEVANPGTEPIDATVVLRDRFNILGFTEEPGTRPDTGHVESFTLAPAATRRLEVRVSRFDLGQNPPPFADVLAWARSDPTGLDAVSLGEPDLATPVRLPGRTGTVEPQPRPTIAGFRIVGANPPRAALTLDSEAGARYRIERNPALQDAWTTARPDIEDCPVDDQGVFVGTGGPLTCEVPCEPGENAMFFRVVRLSE